MVDASRVEYGPIQFGDWRRGLFGSSGRGAAVDAGYRFPLITFYPAIMLTAWYGGFWPGMVATGVSAILVDYFWLAPLRASQEATAGDPVALMLFMAIGMLVSGFSESLHRTNAREQLARIKAEERERRLAKVNYGCGQVKRDWRPTPRRSPG